MGAKGHSNLGLMLLGSVAQGVVQHTSRPVLVARPRSRDREALRTLLVGYDGSADARRAISFLRRLHLPATTRVILTAVVQPFQLPPHLPADQRRQATDAAHAISAQRHRTAERLLESVARRCKGIWEVETAVLEDDSAARALDRAARERDVDLVVVGSRRPAPPGTYLGGSTAEKLVQHAQTSLLVVR
jgi:nucleotide-binding universal stress UspA family protein